MGFFGGRTRIQQPVLDVFPVCPETLGRYFNSTKRMAPARMAKFMYSNRRAADSLSRCNQRAISFTEAEWR